MAMMLVKLFAALRSINVDEKLAQEAAEEAAGVDGKVAELKTGFADLKTSFAELRSEVRVVQAGTALLGLAGTFLATPIAAVIAVMIRFGLDRWRESRFFKEDGAMALPPPAEALMAPHGGDRLRGRP